MWGSQAEVFYNTFQGIADDGIELDTSHAIHTLLFGNTIRDCGHGISQTPVYTGPVFAFYNTIANTHDGGLRVGAGTTAVSWYVHNTFTASSPGGWVLDGSAGADRDLGPSSPGVAIGLRMAGINRSRDGLGGTRGPAPARVTLRP